MGKEHWAAIACVFIFILASLFFTLRVRQGSRVYRAIQRSFWAVSGVMLGNLCGFFGVNAVTLSVSVLFGGPGLAALFCISRL